jgi:hypothetical protein
VCVCVCVCACVCVCVCVCVTGPVDQCGYLVVQQWSSSRVTVMSQWCYSGVTVVLQWCYSGVTVALQWCYSGVTSDDLWCVMVSILSLAVARSYLVLQPCYKGLKHNHKGVKKELQWCQRRVTMVLKSSRTGVIIVVLLWCVMVSILSLAVARSYLVVFEWCWSGVTALLQQYYSGVTAVLLQRSTNAATMCHGVDTVSNGGKIIPSVTTML